MRIVLPSGSSTIAKRVVGLTSNGAQWLAYPYPVSSAYFA
jgi:hypothetical protein